MNNFLILKDYVEYEIADIIFADETGYIYIADKGGVNSFFMIKKITKCNKGNLIISNLDDDSELSYAMAVLIEKHRWVDKKIKKYMILENRMKYGIYENILINNVEYLYLVNVDDFNDFCIRKTETVFNSREKHIVGLDSENEFFLALVYLAKKHHNDKNYGLLPYEKATDIIKMIKKIKLKG